MPDNNNDFFGSLGLELESDSPAFSGESIDTTDSIAKEKLNEIWYLTPFKEQNFRILYHYSKKDLVKTLKDRIGLSLEQMQEKSIQFEKKLSKQL